MAAKNLVGYASIMNKVLPLGGTSFRGGGIR